MSSHLDGVHGAGGEGGVGERQGGAQQVAHATAVVLVLLDGFDAHPLSGQHGLVARGVARGGHELEVSMTTAEEEASPAGTEPESGVFLICLRARSLESTEALYGSSGSAFIRKEKM